MKGCQTTDTGGLGLEEMSMPAKKKIVHGLNYHDVIKYTTL